MSRNKFSASNAIINVFKPPPGWALLRAGLLNAAELRELEPERRQPGSAGHRLMGNSEPAPPGPVGEMRPVRGPRGAARRRRQRPWPSARPGQAQARRARVRIPLPPGRRGREAGGEEHPPPPRSVVQGRGSPFSAARWDAPGTGCATPAAPHRPPISSRSRGDRRERLIDASPAGVGSF